MSETENKSPETKVASSSEHKSAVSDKRLAMLAKHAVIHTSPDESVEKVVVATNGEQSSSEKKVEETPKQEKAKAEPTQKVDGSEPPKVEKKPESEEKQKRFAPNSKEYWEDRAKQFQSKLDTREQEVTKTVTEKDTKISEYETRIQQLESRVKLVDDFEKDPLSIIQNYLPEIQEKLALQSGQPVNYVEQKVLQVKKSLDEKFKQELGENWKYSDYEALQPGTPSFRYKLALEQSRESAKDSFKEYVSKQKQAIADQQRQVSEDKNRLKTEFAFTDEDFDAVAKFAETNTATYYNVARLAMLDKIIEAKIKQAGILAPQKPQADITQTPGSRGVTQAKTVVSDGAKRMVSRLGAGAFGS